MVVISVSHVTSQEGAGGRSVLHVSAALPEAAPEGLGEQTSLEAAQAPIGDPERGNALPAQPLYSHGRRRLVRPPGLGEVAGEVQAGH